MTDNIVRRVIHADGKITNLPGPMQLSEIKIVIGCDCIDTVNLPDGMVMILDDNGYAKELPVNEIATKIYWSRCIPGTTHEILGAVVIVPDSDFGGVH